MCIKKVALSLLMVAGLLPLCPMAQKALSLEQCLQLAVENNIQVKLSQNAVASAELAEVQRKFDFLPNLNLNLPVSKSFGNSADIFTQQIAVSPWTSNPSLNATIVAFRGMSKWSELKNAEYSLLSSQYTLEDLKNDIRLNTALAFFQALFASDNLQIATARIALIEQQMEKLRRQIEAGTKTQGDLYTLQAQLASERVNEVTQRNAFNRSLLDLLLLLNITDSEAYALQRPPLLDSAFAELPDVETVYGFAKLNNPAILKQQFRALAAKYAIRTARAGYMPTLSVTFGLGSFYSSNSRERIGFAVVDSFPEIVYGNTIPMFTQFETNFSKNLSLSLNVPLFNRMSTRQSYKNAQLNYDNALLNIQSEQLDLYKSIRQAHLDAEAAEVKYNATKEQLRALEESYRYAQARYDAGLLDHYAYMEVLNNKTKAEVEQLQALYDRMLKRKILDIYQGEKLEF